MTEDGRRVPKVPKGLGPAGRAAWITAWAVGWTDTPDAMTIEHLARLEDRAERSVWTMVCGQTPHPAGSDGSERGVRGTGPQADGT